MRVVHQQKQKIELEKQSSAAESQKLLAAKKDLEGRQIEISRLDSELEAKRRELEHEKDVLVSESLSTATACQLLEEDSLRANAVWQSKLRDIERRQARLESEKREAAAARQDAAEQEAKIKIKHEQSLRMDFELEAKRQVIERERLALADEECKAHSERRRLEQDAQTIRAELALLEQKKLAVADEESRAMAARSRLEEDVQAMNAEIDENRNRLKQEETRLKALKENEEKRALETQAAIDRQLEAMLIKARQLQEQEERARPRIPPYWSLRSSSDYRLEKDPRMMIPLQQRIRVTAQHSGCDLATARVTRVLRIENGQLWSLYQTRQAFLREGLKANAERGAAPPPPAWLAVRAQQPPLDGVAESVAIDELLLFHGTSEAIALTIAEHGFDERMANDRGFYGAGSYFADRSCKSHQYASQHKTNAGERVMLVCRVTMGWPCLIQTDNKGKRRPPPNPATPGRPFDSIFAESGVARGGQQHHHEFVVFHSNQAYAEFLVYYIE